MRRRTCEGFHVVESVAAGGAAVTIDDSRVPTYDMYLSVEDAEGATVDLQFRISTEWLPIPRIGEEVIFDSDVPGLTLRVVDVTHWMQCVSPSVRVAVLCEPADEDSAATLLHLIDSGTAREWLRQFPAVVWP